MTWHCPTCAGTNAITAPACHTCKAKRPRTASALAFLSAGASPYLVIAILALGAYARVVYLGRARALAEIDASRGRERILEANLTDAHAEIARTTSELDQTRQNLAAATVRLGEVEAERNQFSEQLSALKVTLATQAAQLAIRPKSETKGLRVNNRCSAPVRLAIRYREVDGTWQTHGFWSLDRGPHRLAENDRNGKSVDPKITWNMTYVYAEAVDGSWFYRGVSGETERVRDGSRFLTMKRWDLPIDTDDSYLIELCR